MSESSESDDEIFTNIKMDRFSINNFRPKNNCLMVLDQNKNKKRSSSASANLPKNFVPRLKPKKASCNPSPIILNEKPQQKQITEEHNRTISTSSFDSKNEIKFIKIKGRKSFKNIEEKFHANSDNEEETKNEGKIGSDSDSSKNGEDIKINVKLRSKPRFNNIEKMRARMTKIKFKSINENKKIVDDSNIKENLIEKKLNNIKNIYVVINKLRNNKKKNLYALTSARNRNKSFNLKINYIPTILGFLERNKSATSLTKKGI